MAEKTQRRLAAILMADVVGYSRLMGTDETGTLDAMRAHRRELWDPTIEKYGGRVVNRAGDSALVEFGSAVAAMECSVATQEAMAQRNADVPGDKRIELRIGVNIGEVVVEGEEIYGDGVNIAARLQTLAEPGGIALSGNVQEQIRAKLDLALADDGDHDVKNIAHPVRVWRWSPGAAPDGEIPAENPVKADDAPLPLPDKPSIAVLPFDNMSGDPEQEYFSDGITEDIITELSKFRWFFVTARNSSFTYKGAAVDIKRVGRELGVRFVLEGSVRRAGDRVRVSAQLIEAATGNHIWAERYDRQMEDIFELQDEITRTIASAVEPELSGFERETASRKPTNNLNAWDLYQRGVARIWQFSRSGIEEGRDLLTRAIAMDPGYGRAYGFRSFASYGLAVLHKPEDRGKLLQQATEDVRKAVQIDNRDYFAQSMLGRLLAAEGDHIAALRANRTAIDINPNFAHGYYHLASANFFAGNYDKAVESADLAIRLSPHDPMMSAIVAYKGVALYCLGEDSSAIEAIEQACQLSTKIYLIPSWLVAMYANAGRLAEAAKFLEYTRELEPDFSISLMRNFMRFAQEKDVKRFFEGWQKAGVPE